MLRTNFQKIFVASVALGLLALGAVATAIVHNSSTQADDVFEAVTLLNKVEEQLVRSLTSTVDFMERPADERNAIATSVRTDLNVFGKVWQAFSDRYSVVYPRISDLFNPPVSINSDVERYLALGDVVLRSTDAETQSAAYRAMLRIARLKVQDAIAVAQQIAQNDYSAARERMHHEMHLSFIAIGILLLSGIWLVDRMLVSSALAKEAAESAARAKSDFLSTMSHEIRTPMSGVIGMAELLERTQLTEKQKLYVSTIISSGHALTTIINDVLDLAKINAGKMAIRTNSFELTEMVEDIATLLSPRASRTGTELTVRIQPDLPTHLVGDAGHIRQVILNLAGNAIKFTKNGTVLIDISGVAANGKAHLTISVEDSGIGIPPDRLREIFNSFEQVEEKHPVRPSSDQKAMKGTGLGLAISSKLVDLMGGELRVSSTEGEGSRFWFTLTLAVDPEADAADGVPSEIAGARILVVDDNAINRTVTVEQLNSWSLAPHAVASAQIALKALQTAAENGEPFDLAVLDYQMPSMNGLELAAEIRRNRYTADVPILMLTSIVNSGDEEAFRKNRIDGHLTKPVRASLMFETVVDILHRAGASRMEAAETGATKHCEDLRPEISPATDPRPQRPGPQPDAQQYPRRHENRPSHQGWGRH
jgi:signal transduction histidine kinase/DNA-binding NarL/FixJ family response regulator